MNIGLLTYFEISNLGGFWQAVSTLRSLEKCHRDATVYLLPVNRFGSFSNLVGLTKTHLYSSAKRNLQYMAARNRYLRHYLAKTSIHLYDTSSLRNACNELKLDLLLTGADTCLDMGSEAASNNRVKSYWLPDNVRLLKGFLSSSSGGLTGDVLSTDTLITLRNRINSLSYCYVRDRATVDLLKYISPTCNPIISPDPAFSVFTALKTKPRSARSAGKPVCLFNVEKTSFSLRLASLLEDSYRLISTNKRPMTSMMKSSFQGPSDHLELIANADLIVTLSFHETMAAAALGTPYISVERNSTFGRKFGLTKLSDLCIRLESPHRYFDPGNPRFSDLDQLSSIVPSIACPDGSSQRRSRAICEELAHEFQQVCSKVVTDAMTRI